MKRKTRSGRFFLYPLAAAGTLLLASLLSGCGGGGSSSSSTSAGAPSAQLATGTVTGFGSVFVDGRELDDAHAATVIEDELGRSVNVMLQLGHRVRVVHDGKGSASRITVGAAVVGPVSVLDATERSLTVAAQVVTTNSDATSGIVTAYGGGYSGFDDIVASDLVEVFGAPVYDATAQRYVIAATRIQKLNAISAVRVEGVLSELDDTAKTFKLNGLTVDYASATLTPFNGTLANDKAVVVFGPGGSLVNNLLTASRVRMVGVDDTATGTHVQLGGVVAGYDAGAGTFDLGGTVVRVGSATILPVARTLGNNDYVRVEGTIGADAGVDAETIRIRVAGSSSDLATIRLIGAITDFVDAGHFVVRSVPVDASGIDASTACPGVTLADDVWVDVVAVPQAETDVVMATLLSCKPGAGMPGAGMPGNGTPGNGTTGNGMPGDGTPGNGGAVHGTPVLSLSGSASAVNAGEMSFVLTPAGGPARTVQWNEQTAFAGPGSDASNLDGKTVRVEGYVSGDEVIARVVRIDGSLEADQYRPTGNGWGRYKNRNVR